MSTSDRPAPAAGFSLRGLLREDDWVVCGQTCAEPLTLTRKLVEDAAGLARLNVFLGTTMSRTFDGKLPQGMRFKSYGATGRTASLADRSLLDIVPERYSRLSGMFERRALQADVVLLQVAPGEYGEPCSFGLTNDYLLEAARQARIVIAEVNPQVPWTYGAELPAGLRIDHWVQADTAPVEMAPSAADQVADAIAAHIASLVPDGATLQSGIGALADAALRGLRGHKDLGIHSGVLGDVAAELMQGGSVTNSRKGIDPGVSVTNTVCGGRALFDFVHRNRAVAVRHTSYTHEAAVLAQVNRLHAVNGALQVDLTGQVNCESAGGKLRGGVGGLADFGRAARQCDGGRSINVLGSTAPNGESRIVMSLADNPVTVSRSDVDVIVTEYGVADLRDISLDERARRMVAIAAPQFREPLWREWQDSTMGKKAWH